MSGAISSSSWLISRNTRLAPAEVSLPGARGGRHSVFWAVARGQVTPGRHRGFRQCLGQVRSKCRWAGTEADWGAIERGPSGTAASLWGLVECPAGCATIQCVGCRFVGQRQGAAFPTVVGKLSLATGCGCLPSRVLPAAETGHSRPGNVRRSPHSAADSRTVPIPAPDASAARQDWSIAAPARS